MVVKFQRRLDGVSGVMQENWKGQLEIGKGWDS